MKHSLLLLILFSATQICIGQSIQGKIYDLDTNEGLPFANVILYEDSVQIGGTTTDLDGNYSFDDIAPGRYDLESVYIGYLHQRISVKVAESTLNIDISMEIREGGIDISEFDISNQYIPLFQPDGTLTSPRQFSLKGKVYDKKTDEGLPFANVILLKEGAQVAQASTDLDGNYSFEKLNVDEYDLEAVYLGYFNSGVTGITLKQNLNIDVSMFSCTDCDRAVTVISVNIPLIRLDETSTGEKWEAYEIKRFAGF